MNYVALYNKYRPQTFEDVVGQENIVKLLKRSIEMDRIANGYLLIGNRGLGKTTLARIFSKALNCTGSDIPCNECEFCVAINSDKSMDVIELDAASYRGVDTIRDVVINKVGYRPRSRKKVYIIDECHMLTQEAWNAMLKTLESPPEYCVFIFCTTNPEKIPKTIKSRVQTYKLKDMDNNDIVNRLKYICKKESISADTDALYAIARYAKGGMRDSISSLDQLSLFGDRIDMGSVVSILGIIDEDVCNSLFMAICNRDYQMCVDIIARISADGKNIMDVFDMLCSYTRNYILLSSKCDVTDSDISDDAIAMLTELLKDKNLDYHYLMKLLVDGEKLLKFSSDKQLCFLSILSKYIDGNVKIVKQEQKTEEVKVEEPPSVRNTIKEKLADVDDEPIPIEDAFAIWLRGKRS